MLGCRPRGGKHSASNLADSEHLQKQNKFLITTKKVPSVYSPTPVLKNYESSCRTFKPPHINTSFQGSANNN